MPVQMYRMLVGEIRDVVADGDPYNFIRYLFISCVYRLTHEEEAMVAAQCNSKRYKLAGTSALGGDGDDVYPDSHDIPIRSFDTLRRSHVNCSSPRTTLLHWNQIACELRLTVLLLMSSQEALPLFDGTYIRKGSRHHDKELTSLL